MLSGERLEFVVARSPGNMKVSVQAARSIGTRRAAAGVENGRKFATGSWCVKLTSQCPSSSTLDVELSGRQSADGFDRQIFVANDAGTTSDLLVRWQESLIGGARPIARRLRPKNNFAGDSARFGNPAQGRAKNALARQSHRCDSTSNTICANPCFAIALWILVMRLPPV
jgi:hypothetical protein